MRINTSRAGRFTARLGLESLEGRLLLSATLPAAAPSLGTAQVWSVKPLAAAPASAGFSYSWSVSPSAVLLGRNSSTGNGQSTGSVMVALSAAGSASAPLSGSSGSIPLGLFTTSSSAVPSRPDTYNTPFSINLKIHDAASGATGTLNFKGTVTGALNWQQSALVVRFDAPTQKLTLGGRLYTVTLPGTIHLATPDAAPLQVNASVQVSRMASGQGIPGATAHYSYSLHAHPGAVLTGSNSTTHNHKSSGSVMLALYRPGTGAARVGGPAIALPLSVVTTNSSASAAHPDHFNTPFSIDLVLRDSGTGVSRTVTFKGVITGTLTSKTSTLTLKVTSPLSQTVKLGSHTYTITLRSGVLHVPAPGKTPALLGATLRVK
jgi:hypothetical protein